MRQSGFLDNWTRQKELMPIKLSKEDQVVKLANDHVQSMLRTLLLPKNLSKVSWNETPLEELLSHLANEIHEFYEALLNFLMMTGTADRVKDEAADVSNLLAMIVDKCVKEVSMKRPNGDG